MIFNVLLIFGLLNNEQSVEDMCNLWSESLALQIQEMRSSYDPEFSLKQVYSDTFEADMFASNSNLVFMDYELPYYRDEYSVLSVSNKHHIRSNQYKLLNDEIKLYLTHYQLSELDRFEPGDEKYINSDLLEIDGYLEVVKNTNYFDLMNNMLSIDFENFECSKNNDYPWYVHTSGSKFSLYKKDFEWYKLTTGEYTVIFHVNFEIGEIKYEYFINDEMIEVIIYHSKSIDKNDFLTWLSKN